MAKLSKFLSSFIVMLLATVPPAHGWANRLKCSVELSTDSKMMKKYVLPSSKALHPVSVQVKRESEVGWSSSMQPKHYETIQVQLSFPEELIQQGVEWVVEVSPSEAAEFVGKGAQCRAKRASSKMEDLVSLHIKDRTIPFEIVGAYAAGFEAVTLTDPIQIGGKESETREGL